MNKLVAAAASILFLASVAKGAEERTTLSTLYDGGSHGQIEAFAPEKDGTGWAKTYNELLFFKDGKLQRLKGPTVEGHTYEQVFLGDAEHGYYCPRGESTKKQKLIYRLIDGAARLHCTPLPIDPNGNEIISNTYVAQDGRVLSWNANRIALWQNGAWAMKPVSMTTAFGLPIVFEHEGSLVLVCEQQMHVIAPGGELSTHQTAWKQPTFRCVRWKGRTAIRIAERAKAAEAFDLSSGEPLPLPEALKTLPGPLTDLAAGGNGQLLIKTGNALYALAPDGTLSCPGATTPGLLDAMTDPYNPTLLPKLTEDVRGGLWFSGSIPGLWHYSAQGLEHWDWRHGLRGGVRNIRCSSGQTLLFLLGNFQGKLVQAQLGSLPPAELSGTRADRWTTYKKRLCTGLWEAGGVIAFLPAETNTVRRWDGHAFSEQRLPPELAGDRPFAFSDDRGGLYLQTEPPPSKPYGLKAAITPKGVHIFSRPSQTTSDFQMEEALEWGVREGATGFEYQDMHFLVTPEKHIYWCSPQVSGAVHFFNGTSWSKLRPDKNPVGLAYSPRYGALVRIGGDRFLRYQTGVLEPVDLDTDLLMLNGLFRCPFDRASVMTQPERHLLIAPQSLPGAGGRSTDWESSRSALFYVLPDLAAANLGVNAEGTNEKLLLTFQQYQDVKVHYPPSGGCFLGVQYELPVRVFGGVKVPMELENTPLFDRQIGNIREDANGNIWFEFRDAARVCCYRTDDLRVTVQAEPGETKSDRLVVRAAVEPPVKSVRFFCRLREQEPWQPFSGGETHTLCFPKSGTYMCEVAAVHLGARLKRTGSIRYEARVVLPETRLNEPSEPAAVIMVKTPTWSPPVTCVPTTPAMREACALAWRRADSGEAWQPLGADGRLPLHRLGTNGLYRLLFAAVEEGFRRDESPMCLTVRLELSEEEQLVVLIENLTGNDFVARDAAYIQLKSDRPRWLTVLHRLELQSGTAQRLLQTLDPVRNLLKQQINN